MRKRLLYEELKKENLDLANQFDAIYNESLKIWEEQFSREFTTHGEKHSRQVERNLDDFTRPIQETDDKLTPEEIFVLLSASCLHDIGMQLADKPDARTRHAEIAYKLILKMPVDKECEFLSVELPIKDDRARRAIALIARAHWTEFTLNLKSSDVIYENITGRLKLLGALLAMADLLDISPVRARFFCSQHKLYSLSPKSQLHQTMHNTVRYFEIKRVGSSADLQFQLHWDNDMGKTKELSEWLMSWYQSQWRKLKTILFEESNGKIRWSNDWAIVTFHETEGKPIELSPEAYQELVAERCEQSRIDRKEFIDDFRKSITDKSSRIFLLPDDTDGDGNFLAEWCYAQAKISSKWDYIRRRADNDYFVSRVDIRRVAGLEVASIISQIMEQWISQLSEAEKTRWHLNECPDNEALSHLENFISEYVGNSFVNIFVGIDCENEQILELLRIITGRDEGCGARICLILSNKTVNLEMNQVSITHFGCPPFLSRDVEQYLQYRWAFSKRKSQEIYQAIARIGFAEKPQKIYDYIDFTWKLYSNNHYIEVQENSI